MDNLKKIREINLTIGQCDIKCPYFSQKTYFFNKKTFCRNLGKVLPSDRKNRKVVFDLSCPLDIKYIKKKGVDVYV